MVLQTTASPLIPSLSPDPDAEIIARIRAGERELFAELTRRHNARLYRTVRAILKRDEDCEDVMQEAYFSAFSFINQFKGTARFSTWLTRIAVNAALGRLPTRASQGIMAALPSPLTPEEESCARELAETVDQAIDLLPDDYRTVFVLREVQGLSTEEAADALGLSEAATKVRLHRAKAMLRADLHHRLADAYAFHLSRCARVTAAVMAMVAR